jgi:hypothetical protein
MGPRMAKKEEEKSCHRPLQSEWLDVLSGVPQGSVLGTSGQLNGEQFGIIFFSYSMRWYFMQFYIVDWGVGRLIFLIKQRNLKKDKEKEKATSIIK